MGNCRQRQSFVVAVILFIILHSCKSLYVILDKLARDRAETFDGKFARFEDEKKVMHKLWQVLILDTFYTYLKIKNDKKNFLSYTPEIKL